MKPIPPSPLFHGSTAANANAAATAASTAVPPAASTSAPTVAAVRLCEATMPPRDEAPGLRTSQFCVRCILVPQLFRDDRVDAGRIEGVVAGDPGDLVIRRRVAPDRILGPPDLAARRRLDRPVRRFAFERAGRVVLGRAHQIEPHILFRKTMHGAVAGLLDPQGRGAVGDGRAGEDDFDMPPIRLEVDAVFGAADKSGGWVRHFGSSAGSMLQRFAGAAYASNEAMQLSRSWGMVIGPHSIASRFLRNAGLLRNIAVYASL